LIDFDLLYELLIVINSKLEAYRRKHHKWWEKASKSEFITK